MLTKNVAMQVDMPKLHEKAIIRLEPDEAAIMLVEKALLDYIEGPRVLSAAHAVSGEENALFFSLGTELYQETGDIYLVADVLGHSDVGTTKSHYAARKDQNRRKAASVIKLREE